MGAMFSKPKVPKPTPPKVLPMVDEAALEETRRKSRATQSARGGRQSTMLTSGDTLGGN